MYSRDVPENADAPVTVFYFNNDHILGVISLIFWLLQSHQMMLLIGKKTSV